MPGLAIIQNWWLSDLILTISLGTVGFLRLRSVLWITIDVSRRTSSLSIQILSIVLWFIPFYGLFIYFLIRPLNYKYDKIFWRETILLNSIECPDCWWINLKDFDYCIYCWENLQLECKECKAKYPFDYEYCPKCSAPNLSEEIK